MSVLTDEQLDEIYTKANLAAASDESMHNWFIAGLRAVSDTAVAAAIPEGYALVPMLMTDEMANAFDPDNKIRMTYLRTGWMMACAIATKEVKS